MYYKIIHITPFGAFHVSYTMEPERPIGQWQTTIFGSRLLTLQASEAEFRMAVRNKIPSERPMRRDEDYTWGLGENRPYIHDWFVPNRHQRKRSLDEIIAVAERMTGRSVSCSEIKWIRSGRV